MKIKDNQILVSKWGYDQTNVDFYQVVKGAEAGKFCHIKPIRAKYHSDAGLYARNLMPAAFQFLQKNGKDIIIKKKVKINGNEPYLSLSSYSLARIWAGKPVMATSGH